MRLPYKEGTWFAVPLRNSGFGIGVISRMTSIGKILIGYFFGSYHPILPNIQDLEKLQPYEAVRILRFGDLALMKGEWPIIGHHKNWIREEWPTPPFFRFDELSGRSWLVYYSDTDPSRVLHEELYDEKSHNLQRDAVLGPGAIELVLSKLLDN